MVIRKTGIPLHYVEYSLTRSSMQCHGTVIMLPAGTVSLICQGGGCIEQGAVSPNCYISLLAKAND